MKRIFAFGFIISFFLIVAACCPCPQCPIEPATPSLYSPVILAEFHVWHGMTGHANKPYNSQEPAVIDRQIADARGMGISGFVVNWYGPACGVSNDEERDFQDKATAVLFERAEVAGFAIALLYDEGTVLCSGLQTGSFQSRVVSDLDYARKYYALDAYMKINGKPALFVFPYEKKVDQFIDWKAIRATFISQVTLIDKDPDPLSPVHDESFDGFYAWVTATNGLWDSEGMEWGEIYLQWFYPTMRSAPYAGKVLVGGVWPGFDNTFASWGDRRYISRRCTLTFDTTMALALGNEAPYIMIETWNDYEEGTDVESGILMSVDLDKNVTEILTRSTPLRVDWNTDYKNPRLQVYKEGIMDPIYNQLQTPGVWVGLQTGVTYELKLWADGLPEGCIARSVIIRRQDPVPCVSPVFIDE